MLTSMVTKSGKIMLPDKVREQLSLEPDDKVRFVRYKDGYIIKPLKDFTKMRGVLQVHEPQDLESVREQVLNAIAKE